MSNDNNNMMLPEEALNRFQKPDTALSGIDVSPHDYELPRYGFIVGGIGFLISSGILCEVMKNFKVYPIPNTRQWMHGLVNLRGNLIPVYDLSMLLGLSEEPMKQENLLIIDSGPASVGILIDSLPLPCDISDWTQLSHVPKLPAGLSECVSASYSINDLLWLGFNHKEFFKNVMDKVAANLSN